MMSKEFILDRIWYKHLTPSEFHDHFAHFDYIFREYLGRHKHPALGWDIAGMAGSPVRVRVGDPEPVFHFIAMLTPRGWKRFSIPPDGLQKIRPDTRVSVAGRNVDIAEAGELFITPTFRLEVVTDPYFAQETERFVATANDQKPPMFDRHKITNPSLIFSADVGHLVTNKKTHGKHSKPPKYVLYQHMFGDESEYPMNGPFYVGITKRDWKARWREHRAAINRGSQRKFYRTYRERLDEGRLTHVHHKVMGAVDDLQNLKRLEKEMIDGHWHDKRLLNMKRGG